MVERGILLSPEGRKAWRDARSEGAGKFPDKSPKGKRSFPERKEVQTQLVRNGVHVNTTLNRRVQEYGGLNVYTQNQSSEQ